MAADRKINAAGNDDEGRAHRHDGDETGVLGHLRQILRVEEFILRDDDRFAFASGIRVKNALAFALRVGFKKRDFDRAAKNSEQQAKNADHNQQTALLKTERGAARGGSIGRLGHELERR